MAYYFHWSRGDIMAMTGSERKTWLSQIVRIHHEIKQQRQRDFDEQIGQITALKTQE